MEWRVETTADGSSTLRATEQGETYHSVRGAMGEARHVFIEAGFLKVAGSRDGDGACALPIRIFEMGFGTGLNAWLTLCEARRTEHRAEYTAVETNPVPEEVAERLSYTGDGRFMEMHRARWGVATRIADEFDLKKLHGDIRDVLAGTENLGSFDLVYYDAFAPDHQPELWTADVFAHLAARMREGGVLVTYSAKGDVRRALQEAGFTVEKLPGALGKRHMLRAVKG